MKGRINFRVLPKQLADMNDAERAARLEGFGFIKLSTQTPYSPVNTMFIAIQSPEIKQCAESLFGEARIGECVLREVKAQVDQLRYRIRILQLSDTIRDLCEELLSSHPVSVMAARAAILGRTV